MGQRIDNNIEVNMRPKDKLSSTFFITPEQKNIVKFPDGKISLKEFVSCINQCIEGGKSKKLTIIQLKRNLKKLGILSDKTNENVNKKTIINDTSTTYGFESERRLYNEIEYEVILINEKGKKYLLENLEFILNSN